MDNSSPPLPSYEEASSQYTKRHIDGARLCIAPGARCRNYAVFPPDGYRYNVPLCMFHWKKDELLPDEDAPEFIRCGGKDCTHYMHMYFPPARTPCCHAYLCDDCMDLETHFACCDTAFEVPEESLEDFVHFGLQHEPKFVIDLESTKEMLEEEINECEELYVFILKDLQRLNKLIYEIYALSKVIDPSRPHSAFLDQLVEMRRTLYGRLEETICLVYKYRLEFPQFLPVEEA